MTTLVVTMAPCPVCQTLTRVYRASESTVYANRVAQHYQPASRLRRWLMRLPWASPKICAGSHKPVSLHRLARTQEVAR